MNLKEKIKKQDENKIKDTGRNTKFKKTTCIP